MGRCIELIYTPVRKDGIKGTPKLVKSDEIAPGILFLSLFFDSFLFTIISYLFAYMSYMSSS